MDDERAAWAADVATHREIDGRRWRVSDPRIPEGLRQRLVDELMAARRAVKAAGDDGSATRAARDRVHDAKVALGERGLHWWLATTDAVEADDRVRRTARALRRTADRATRDDDARDDAARDDEVAAVTSRPVGEVRRVIGVD